MFSLNLITRFISVTLLILGSSLPSLAQCEAFIDGGEWNDLNTWLCFQVPTAADDVIIPDGYDIVVNGAAANCRSLTLKANGANTSLTVNTTLNIVNDLDLDFSASSGSVSLIANSAVTVGGDITSASFPNSSGDEINLTANAAFDASNWNMQSNTLGGVITGTINMLGTDNFTFSGGLSFRAGKAPDTDRQINMTVNLEASQITCNAFTQYAFYSASAPRNTVLVNCKSALNAGTMTIQRVSNGVAQFDTRFANSAVTTTSSLSITGGVLLTNTTQGLFTMSGTVPGSFVGDYPALTIAGTATLGSAITVKRTLTINGTLNTNGKIVNAKGNLVNNGTLNANSGDDFIFNGTSAQSISGTSDITFSDLIVNNTNDLTINLDTVKISGSLALQTSGTAINTNGKLKLLDSGTGLALIKEIPTGCAVNGSVTAQFYLGKDAALTTVGYRTLSMPLQGQTIADIQYHATNKPKGFYTYGFSGSNLPSYTKSTSIYTYDNTNVATTAAYHDGWKFPTSSAQSITPQSGLNVYCGPSSTGQSTYFMELSGNIYQGTQTLNTNMKQAPSGQEIWAIVGNPFLAPISVSGMTLTNCGGAANDEVWVYSTEGGAWNTPSSSIAPFQAFYVQMGESGTGSITVPESAKTTAKDVLIKSAQEDANRIKIQLTEGNSTMLINYTYLDFDKDKTPAFELSDILDIRNPAPYPDLSLVSSDDQNLCIYKTSPNSNHIEVPIRARTYNGGQHSLSFSNIDDFESCLILEDKFLNTFTSIDATSNSYSFDLADTTSSVRFVLHVYKLAESSSTTNSQCFGDHSGSAEVKLVNHGNKSNQVKWYDEAGQVVLNDQNATSISKISNLSPGNYSYGILSGNLSCAENRQYFTIFEMGEMKPSFEVKDQAPAYAVNTALEFVNTSEGAISGYSWNFGDGSSSHLKNPNHTYVNEGVYQVSLTNENGDPNCNTLFSSEIKITSDAKEVGLKETEAKGFTHVVINNELILSFAERTATSATLELISINGQVLLTQEIAAGVSQSVTNVSELPDLFVARISGGSESTSVKIAK